MESKDAGDLLQKYNDGKCTPEERVLVEAFYLDQDAQASELSEPELEESSKRVLLKSEVSSTPSVHKMTSPKHVLTIAAATLILLGIWSLLFVKSPSPVAHFKDINPGSDKAILTLGNGTKINLSDVKSGSLLNQSGIEIIKTEDGTLVYKVSASKSKTSEYNTITTPKGGQYKIMLPDGTRVWLNAASSLSYRTSINEGRGERKVQLSGEAYFEVVKMKSGIGMQKNIKNMPFIVKTDKQEVIVLGTHFNINSYNDEPNTKTTLLEGSVKIYGPEVPAGGILLNPGDQGVNSGSEIKVTKVDTDEIVAWKNGEFNFAAENLESIMRKIARWYDVDIVYADSNIGSKLFSGTISKFEKVSEVLRLLEATTAVKFKIEGRRITVM